MEIAGTLMQWMHLSAAAVLIGGLFMARYVTIPAIEEQAGPSGGALIGAILGRFRLVNWTGMGALLVSGLFNLHEAWMIDSALYKIVLHVKLTLVAILFSVALGLTLPIPALDSLKRRRRLFMTFNLHLAFLIVLLSAYLRKYA